MPHLQYLIMLAHRTGSLLLRISHTMAQVKLFKPHVDRHFNGNLTGLDKEVKQLAKKYSLSTKGVEKLFRANPLVFVPGSEERTEIEQKISFLNALEQQQPIAGTLNDLLFDNRHLLLEMSVSQIEGFIQTVKDFGISDNKAVQLFSLQSNLVHNKFDIIYREKATILKDYLSLTDEQILQIFLLQPFLLTCSSATLRQSICYFVERRSEILTREKIVDILKNLGEIFLFGRDQLALLIHWYSSWGIQKKQLWGILTEHPLLLLNHPAEIFHFKAKMLRQFRFTQEMGQSLLRNHPSALFCSIRSLESKFLTARDRLKITITPNNIEFLTFKFMANIRPRSEMLIRAKIPYTSEDIVDYLKCSEQEFLKKTRVPIEKYLEEKQKFAITTEIDAFRKKCLKNYPTEKKIFEASIKYYPKEDVILKAK